MNKLSLVRVLLLSLTFSTGSAFGQNAAAEPVNKVRPLGTNVNTSESELAATRYADKMYYTSVATNPRTGKKSDRIFSVLREYPAILFEDSPRDFTLQMAHSAFSLTADRMYFSLYRKGRKGEHEDCRIWYRDRNFDGSWTHPVRLPRHINLPDFVTTHPALGYDRTLKKEMLYFASDREGGKGGMDIWACDIIPGTAVTDDTFGEPYCLPHNTEKDETCPFFDTQTQTLYFSSNGRRGYGGFDIFKSQREVDGTWAVPFNLKEPINSSADDLFFSLHFASGLAYFSSNRLNENCGAEECRNFDIYQATLGIEMRVEIINEETNTGLAGCNLELLDPVTKAQKLTLLNLPEGQAILDLEVMAAYQLIVSKSGFFPVFLEIETSEDEAFSRLEKRVLMKPMKPVASETSAEKQ